MICGNELYRSYLYIATVVAIILSYMDFLRIPVYWPLLLVYIVLVFLVACKQRISHMIKFKYVPFDANKMKYNTKKNDSTK